MFHYTNKSINQNTKLKANDSIVEKTNVVANSKTQKHRGGSRKLHPSLHRGGLYIFPGGNFEKSNLYLCAVKRGSPETN